MKNKELSGHLAALATIVVWGTTYIATKVLLRDFSPVEILMIRFVMGYAFLWLLYPHRLKTKSIRQELLFMGAGLTGMTLYYLLENVALTYTMASNVGVIIAAAPFLTSLLAKLFLKEKRLGAGFYFGFVLALAGIAMISFNGVRLSFSPKGDLLTVGAALAWAAYSVITKKIGDLEQNVVQSTRRIFFWGLLFLLPALLFFDFSPNMAKLLEWNNILNFLYLGIGASALCFVIWNYAIGILGAVKANVYIYLNPVVTVITSVLVLHERLTPMSVAGTVLTLLGLILSQNK